MEVRSDAFPFAANALRSAEATTYPEPYATPLTREGVTRLNAAENAIAQERIKREKTQGIGKFDPQEIAEIKRLYGEEKMSSHRIASRFGCAQSSIWWHVRDIKRTA